MKSKIYVSAHVPDVSWAWAIKMGKYTFYGCPYLMSTFSLCYVVHKNFYVKYLQKHGALFKNRQTEKLFKTWFSNKHWKNTLTSNLSWVGFRVKPPYSLIRLLFYFFLWFKNSHEIKYDFHSFIRGWEDCLVSKLFSFSAILVWRFLFKNVQFLTKPFLKSLHSHKGNKWPNVWKSFPAADRKKASQGNWWNIKIILN